MSTAVRDIREIERLTAPPAPDWALGWWRVRARNPAFNDDAVTVRRELMRMANRPKPLERPVVVLAGYRAWHWVTRGLARRLRLTTSNRRRDFVAVSYPDLDRLDDAIDHAVARIEARFPDRPIDLVGISMGGLIGRGVAARLAQRDGNACPPRVRRLFTIATPHRGARLAEKIAPDAAAECMRPGSDWLCNLDTTACGAEIIPYAVLNDMWVGAKHTAPRAQEPHWTSGWRFGSHFTITHNRAIIADIALRLRGERPLTGTPTPAPVE